MSDRIPSPSPGDSSASGSGPPVRAQLHRGYTPDPVSLFGDYELLDKLAEGGMGVV